MNSKHTYQIFFLLSILFSNAVLAQRPIIDYTKVINTTGQGGDVRINEMVESPTGQIYAVGVFDDQVDLNPDAPFLVKNLGANSSIGGFILKLDDSGGFKWAKALVSHPVTSATNRFTWLSGVYVDDSSNVYITGDFEDGVDLIDDGNLVNTIQGTLNGHYSFVAKYDSLGNYKWHKSFESSIGSSSNAITSDPDGNLYININCSGSTTFEGNNGTNIVINASNQLSNLVVKLSPAGSYQWHHYFTGDRFSQSRSIKCFSDGSVFLCGSINGSYYGATVSTDTLQSMGQQDMMLLKLDTAGNYHWMQSFGGTGRDVLYQVQDDDTVVYIAGRYDSLVDFDNSTNSTIRTAKGNGDILLAAYTKSGDFLWVRTLGGVENDIALDMKVDRVTHDVLLVGSADSKTLYDDQGDSTLTIGFENLFSRRYDASGNIQSSFFSPSDSSIVANQIVISRQNEIIIGGYSGDDFLLDPFNPSTLIAAQNQSAGLRSFITKFSEVFPHIDTTLIEACDSGSFNGQTYYANTTFYDTTYRSGAFDSIALTQLNVSTLSDSIYFANNRLFGVDSLATSYQWYNCDSNAIMVGDTFFSAYPPRDGNYALIMEKGGCLDTTACLSVTGVIGLSESTLQESVSIYPNPASNSIHISKPYSLNILNVRLTNLSGQIVLNQKKTYELDVAKLESGVYLLNIETSKGLVVKRFVKI